MRDLADVIADLRGDAQVLRRSGHEKDAAFREQIADDVSAAASEWLTWLSESDAMLHTGRSRDWLRQRFSWWEREGHARLNGKERQYRACVLMRRMDLVAARQAGIDAAKSFGKAS